MPVNTCISYRWRNTGLGTEYHQHMVGQGWEMSRKTRSDSGVMLPSFSQPGPYTDSAVQTDPGMILPRGPPPGGYFYQRQTLDVRRRARG